MKFATKAIRAGQEPDSTTGAVIVPIYQSANFVFKEVGKPNAFEYSRSGNPTRSAYEKCLAVLEEAKFGIAFGSGMAAVDAAISILRPGDHVVSSEIFTAVRSGCLKASPNRAASGFRMWTAPGRKRLKRRLKRARR